MNDHAAAASGAAGGHHKPAAIPSSLLWLFGLGCGAVVTLNPALAILLAILLTPSFAIRLFDGPAAFHRCLPFGLAAALSPSIGFWQAQAGASAALDAAGNPEVLAGVWSAQGGGWLLGEILPLLITVWLQAQAHRTKAALRQQRRRYEREWGLPPPTG